MSRLICHFDIIRLQGINISDYYKRELRPISLWTTDNLISIFILPGSYGEHVNILPAVIISAAGQRCSIFKMLMQEDRRIRSKAPGKTFPLAGAGSGSGSSGLLLGQGWNCTLCVTSNICPPPKLDETWRGL